MVLMKILKPLSFFFTGISKLCSKPFKKHTENQVTMTEDELSGIVESISEEDDFDEVLAYEVITPRVDMEAIDIRDPYEVNVRKLMDCTYSRVPVFEDTPDKIIGILHLNHFYKAFVDSEKVNIRELLLPVTEVHKTKPLPDVLEKMKETKSHMVVVLDEYGGTMGILTMEDVLEQLVGEIFDESDEMEREFICIDETHFEADGDMRIYDFFDEFDIDIDDEESFEGETATIGGWVTSMLDGEQEEGASVRFENLIITVKKADGVRIDRITVEELP